MVQKRFYKSLKNHRENHSESDFSQRKSDSEIFMKKIKFLMEKIKILSMKILNDYETAQIAVSGFLNPQ